MYLSFVLRWIEQMIATRKLRKPSLYSSVCIAERYRIKAQLNKEFEISLCFVSCKNVTFKNTPLSNNIKMMK